MQTLHTGDSGEKEIPTCLANRKKGLQWTKMHSGLEPSLRCLYPSEEHTVRSSWNNDRCLSNTISQAWKWKRDGLGMLWQWESEGLVCKASSTATKTDQESVLLLQSVSWKRIYYYVFRDAEKGIVALFCVLWLIYSTFNWIDNENMWVCRCF